MPTERQQAEHFELLLEVGRLLSSKLELSELLHTIMQLAAKVVNAETASLLLVDLSTNELYFDVALGLDPELSKIRLKMGEGIAGTVAGNARPEIINDVKKDPRWSRKVDDDSGFVTRSILAAPILLRGRCIGVVEAINRIGGDFTETDLRIFEAFASQAGVAIENARLFASLIEEKSKLGKLLNEMRDAAILTDGKGGILVANDAARGFMGENSAPRIESAVQGMTVTPPLEMIFSSKEPLLSFEAVRQEPKMLILAGTASLIQEEKSGETTGRVVVFRDVTEERREEGLKRNFLSLISHKLKTPLASITGYSQLLIEELKSKPEGEASFQMTAMKTVYQQGVKLSGLVEKLLNYTVLEDLQATELSRIDFKIAEVLQGAAEAMKPILDEKSAALTIDCPDELLAAGDPNLVKDVLKNMIENAVKFNPSKTPTVSLKGRFNGDAIEITVADNGPGIPPEEHEKVFRKFYQIDASFTGQIEGWGLGLSFAREVVEKLGGKVSFESRLGSGSEFLIRLPRTSAP